MKNYLLKFALVAVIIFSATQANSQSLSDTWAATTAQRTQNLEKEFRAETPSEYKLFQFDAAQFKAALQNVPQRNEVSNSQVIVQFPTNNGELQSFRVAEASVFSPELQAQYPEIRSYVGQGIEDPSAIARFSVSAIGTSAMITSANYKTVYVTPYTKNKEYYMQYSRADLPSRTDNFICHTDDGFAPPIDFDAVAAMKNADDGMLRTFRLALACTGEYSIFHLNNQGIPGGATEAVKKAAVLMAMNTSMTRVNGIYEKDLAVTMVIVPNNIDIIFLDPATDGYTNNNGGAMLGENQAKCDAIIGTANYDIGHVFSTGGGGVAQLNSPCTSNKARGVTGLPQPIGDFFDVDYVAHEMGHQYGGNHTFNNSCGNNRNGGTAVEPGSGSTIMAYAGICPPNVQAHSDDFFNGVNILEMWQNISAGAGQCAAQTATNNDPPIAEAGDSYDIPSSTPFVMTGTATDVNPGDVLTYNWEQKDNIVAPMPPSPTSTEGPLFLSLVSNVSPSRYFPALPTVISGATSTTWEVIPSVTRFIRFRLTVRDNAAAGGSSSSDLAAVIVDGNSGPFLVTSQTTNETWNANGSETITWDVAGTDAAPVDTPNVDIFLSIDGGLTFPTVLATAVPNNGSAVISVPLAIDTNQARVMVKGNPNVFYQVNTTNFTISSVLAVSEVVFEDLSIYPNPTNGNFSINFKPQSASDVNIALYDVRGREIDTQVFENNGSTFSESMSYNGLNTGMYFVKISNNGQSQTVKLIIE
ncbi:zinc-dependent metalloprotease [Ulvibacter antarcticus]|uniref:Putative secreted protein (Por secretion system target) n=1 Tax=Ulvibacter antarcticus TaxID=442714 RepID=A0A3L9YDR4_9FLAO|nr:zinc-dependent metalloprotease family protein [Ulvibacter antarcticus]RMA57179.1 putative secreted protein (Por secretion system target) [Ulvibacter antarcticus]